MTIVIKLEDVLKKTGKTSQDIVAASGHTAANISRIRTGNAKAIRFSTLNVICEVLHCQPGDIIKHVRIKDKPDHEVNPTETDE